MSKPIILEVKAFGGIHALEISSRREIAGKINDLFPAGDWDQVTRQARDFLLRKANGLWTREFGKGEPQTKAHKVRPSGVQLATWHVVAERGEPMAISLEERQKPLTQEEEKRVGDLAADIETYALQGKEHEARAAKKAATRKRSQRVLSSLEAVKGCKAPKQGPAIEMDLTPARKLASKKLREARAAKKAAINAAKRALEARFSSLGPVVINAAVETIVNKLEAVDAEINFKAIKTSASTALLWKATPEERNALIMEQRA